MENKHYIIPIFVPHMGCPFNCVFCNQEIITGSHEIVDENYVINKTEEYLKTMKKGAVIEISFFGGTFTAIPENLQRELLSVAKGYKDRGIINLIRLSTRPDFINHHILSYLKEFKVDIIELGVQSMDEEVLFLSGRGHSKKDVVEASKLIKEYGFTLGHQVMLGLPGDSVEKDISTLCDLVNLKPSLLRIYPSLVIKNTPMEKMYNRKTYEPYSLEKAVEVSASLLKIAHENNINVIRIGLQPTDEINIGKDIVGGPFHPAFRELVEGYLYSSSIKERAKKEDEVRINPKEISKLYADKKRYFKDLLPLKLKIIEDREIDRGKYKIKNQIFSIY